MMELDRIICGDCREELPSLPEDSIDAIVTDPPYELAFMGRKWDASGIAYNTDLWAGCLRVLKPGGHMLSFGGSRTYHRMACAIEDAGFEIRDSIHWCYGSGFPKSLDISKALDKMAGAEREILRPKTYELRNDGGYSGGLNTTKPRSESCEITAPATPAAIQWAGWGSALKPAAEFICLARKPLSDSGKDIAKIICSILRENDLYPATNDISWRIERARDAAKQKTSTCFTITKPPQTVEISVWSVKESETPAIGREIAKLLEHKQKNIETTTGTKPTPEAELFTEKTKIESVLINKIIVDDEKRIPSLPMVENANVAENPASNSSQLITSTAEEEPTGRHLTTPISTSRCGNLDIPKRDIGCSAGTVTVQWVSMDIARTIEIQYRGNNYFFKQLSDGSFVWNEELPPFIEPKKLTIAANVLRWGCGGINIDGCRVEMSAGDQKSQFGPIAKEFLEVECAQNGIYNEGWKRQAPNQNMGRFPANLIHDGSQPVLAEFAKAGERKTGDTKPHKQRLRSDVQFMVSPNTINSFKGDTGSAARFFKSCPFTEEDIPAFVYYAKASRAEREAGLDGMPIVAAKNHTTGNNGEGDHRTIGRATTLEKSPLRMAKNSHPTIKPLALMRYLCRLITPPGGIVLDPFAGSGTTCLAAKQEGFRFIGIEKEPEYAEIAQRRIAAIPTSLSRWEEDARP